MLYIHRYKLLTLILTERPVTLADTSANLSVIESTLFLLDFIYLRDIEH